MQRQHADEGFAIFSILRNGHKRKQNLEGMDFFVKGPHWWMVKTERKRVETI